MKSTVKSKKLRKNLWLKIILIIVIILAVLSCIAGNLILNFAIGRAEPIEFSQEQMEAMMAVDQSDPVRQLVMENWVKQNEKTVAFLDQETEQQIQVVSDDGLTLKGGYYENQGHRWVLLIHGYNGVRSFMYGYAQNYFEAGYHVVVPDLRAYGESEGDYVGMGWLERLDMQKWIQWILEQDEQAEIVLHGVSMGAATTMMVSGDETPDAVKVFVEDCGFTSAWDIFSIQLKNIFHLPQFPVMYIGSFLADIKAGYNFKEASALKQVKKCEKPMLFIHGVQDDFIPVEMEDLLYEAKPGENKKKIAAEGAGHTESVWTMGDEYWEEVFSFINEYMD